MPDGETQSPPVDDYDDDGVQDKRPYVVVSPLVVVYRMRGGGSILCIPQSYRFVDGAGYKHSGYESEEWRRRKYE
eukprot:scaffold2566_cov125-Alexandrium_tamarense.AAC.2